MVVTIRSLGLQGIKGYEVTVECALSGGLPAFDVVGLPDAAVKESRERVRAAVKSCAAKFPVSRITINLAPAALRKEGTVYDLPILLGILAAQGDVDPPPPEAAFLGELSLTGALRPITGILPMATAAARSGVRELYVPAENAAEATLAEGLTVYPVENVEELLSHLQGRKKIAPAIPWTPEPGAGSGPDFSEVMGQENVKRALEIAAAGGHNILLIGSPGAGKSMLARRLPSILPDMTRQEALEATEIWSVAGLTDRSHPLLLHRPFRSPHHTVSAVALAGGGAFPRPGEISLAHNGVLFLDELPEFSKDAMEVLRQPIEDGEVTIHHPHRRERMPALPVHAGVRHESLPLRLAGPPLRTVYLHQRHGGEVCGEDLRPHAGPDGPPCGGALGGVRGHAPPGKAGELRPDQSPRQRRPRHPGGALRRNRRELQRQHDPRHGGLLLRAGRRRGTDSQGRLRPHGPDGPEPRPDPPGGPDHRRPGGRGGDLLRPSGGGHPVPQHGNPAQVKNTPAPSRARGYFMEAYATVSFFTANCFR